MRYRPETAEATEGLKGAYGWVVGLAGSEGHFREAVAADLDALGQAVIEIEDVGLLDPEKAEDSQVGELAAVLSDEWPIQYRTFHAYDREDS